MRVRNRLAAISMACVCLGACGGPSTAPSSPTQAKDSVTSVINMVPAAGTALQAGQTVTFSGTPGYTLASADVGSMIMVIQDQTDRALPASTTQPIVVVHRGSADVTLSETITIPASGVTSVRVFFVLAPAGAATTYASAQVSYPVR
jgi:hypothetical protein